MRSCFNVLIISSGISHIAQCVEIYEALRQSPSIDGGESTIAQFSHAISTAHVLSGFHDFQKCDRLSDSGLRHYTSVLQPTLRSAFSQIPNFEEMGDNFLESAALFFFNRCVDLAMGVWSQVEKKPKTLCQDNLLAYSPDKALLEVANFCNARLDEEGKNKVVLKCSIYLQCINQISHTYLSWSLADLAARRGPLVVWISGLKVWNAEK